MNKKIKNLTGNLILFLLIMIFTFVFVFRGQDLEPIKTAAKEMSPIGIIVSVILSIAFVSAEGCMIWYLLKKMGNHNKLLRCIAYSFIGFFFSGITPSATGGQPMQLYYMKKDGNSLSESSVVLMTVAVIYKFVLVVIGVLILCCWNQPLREYLQSYYLLYLLGLFLNTALVVVLLAVMFFPHTMQQLALTVDHVAVRMKILKPNDSRKEKITQFIGEYQKAVSFLHSHKKVIGVVMAGTFLQRCSVFALTYVVYWGLGLSGTNLLTILFLQASVYIAVDMLPVPGAQGITEAMYQMVFCKIFTGKYLLISLCFTRGVSFYFLMIVSGIVVVISQMQKSKEETTSFFHPETLLKK